MHQDSESSAEVVIAPSPGSFSGTEPFICRDCSSYRDLHPDKSGGDYFILTANIVSSDINVRQAVF